MSVFLLAVVVAFVPGERLSYDVKLGPMRMGGLELLVLAPDTVQGESCRRFQATMGVRLGFVFWGEYRLDAWARARDLVTLRSAKQTDESRYHASWTADYRYEDSVVVYSSGDTFDLPTDARDVLTLWYFMREAELAVGDTLDVHVHSDRRDQEAMVVAVRRTVVSVPAGEFDCLELLPGRGGVLGAVYLSTDEARLPVVIRTGMGGLKLSAVLRGVEMEESE